MFAVILTKFGDFYKLLGFVDSVEEADEIADDLVEEYGYNWLVENGYKVNVELAG